MNKQKRHNVLSYIAAAVLFVTMLGMLVRGTKYLGDATDMQGLEATQQAVQKAAVLCYATEGFYPPSLGYIEERYGVQIDYNSYVVRYEVMGANIMPTIYVILR